MVFKLDGKAGELLPLWVLHSEEASCPGGVMKSGFSRTELLKLVCLSVNFSLRRCNRARKIQPFNGACGGVLSLHPVSVSAPSAGRLV